MRSGFRWIVGHDLPKICSAHYKWAADDCIISTSGRSRSQSRESTAIALVETIMQVPTSQLGNHINCISRDDYAALISERRVARNIEELAIETRHCKIAILAGITTSVRMGGAKRRCAHVQPILSLFSTSCCHPQRVEWQIPCLDPSGSSGAVATLERSSRDSRAIALVETIMQL